MDPAPPPHRPAPRCATATATPPRTRRPPPPGPQCPLRRTPVWQTKAGASELDADRPPAKSLSWAPEHPRCGLRREGHGSAAPHARRPPPAPSLRLRCHRRRLPSFGQNDTPAVASGKKDTRRPSVQDRGWPATAADPDLAAGRAPPLRPPARRTSPGRADSGERHPAPGQRPAPASCLKEERLPRCGLRLEASTPQASRPKDRCPFSLQPPDRRGERADTHPAQTGCIPQRPGQSRLIDEAFPLIQSADGVFPPNAISSHDIRPAQSDSAVPSDLNVFRYGNARRRTIQVGQPAPLAWASDWWVRPGSAASQATIRSSRTDVPCPLRA